VIVMIIASVITCPYCGTAKAEIMPTNACQHLYECTGCGATLQTQAGLLLRVLFLWLGTLSTYSGRAFGHYRGTLLLHRKSDVTKVTIQHERDWLSSPFTSSLAWWVPEAAIMAGLLIQVPVRTTIWVIHSLG
jgi:DNA-directed RNA polymerase subunit RPC12/RpoP